MPVYRINKSKLEPLSRQKIDLEKDIQVLTEQNLETVFGLKFVSGASNKEFHISAQEQEFYIDTLAFDEVQKSFVILEYKKDRSFSVIDQGFAYLSAIVNHQADFILELNERLNKSYKKDDIDWEASRVIFVSPEFTNYQKNAINFKNLPFYLYEVEVYSGGIIDYTPIKPYQTSASVTPFIKDARIQKVSKEIKVYDEDFLIKSDWNDTRDLLHAFEQELMNMEVETKVKYTKFYIAYTAKRGKEWVNYVEIVPQKQGLKVYYRFYINYINSQIKLTDCSKVGHWTNGNTSFLLDSEKQFPEAVRLSIESYKYIQTKK